MQPQSTLLPCAVAGCDRLTPRASMRRGLCRYHRQKIRPAVDRSSPEWPVIHFWGKVDKTPACWLWRGTVRGGYGVMVWHGHQMGAHRISWELAHGPIPAGMVVCHQCDNPPCVNPAHLFLGAHSDNVQDMVRKGRQSGPRGQRCVHSRLTPEKVLRMRAEAARGVSAGEIGRRFGVSHQSAWMVVTRRAWKHLPDPPM